MKTTTMTMTVLACAALAFTTGACAQATPASGASSDTMAAGSSGQLANAQYQAVLNGNWRDQKNRSRDQYRHPEQTLKFFHLKPSQTVIEITPGGGWYTQVLAPLLNAHGHYIAAVGNAKDGEEGASAKSLKSMFASNPDHYGNATIHRFNPKAPVLGPPGSADEVLTFRNVHNWVMADTAPSMFKAFYTVLKPGGILGVVDHRAAKGASLTSVKGSGYLPTDFVIKLATDAGFKLEGTSQINANPKDTKNYAKGVWTLPPTLTLGDKDKAKYEAIGESDRMTLRFMKPTK